MALPLVSAENLKIITMDPSSNNPNPNASNDNEMSKRQAMTGQWRTPPLPVFASTQQQQQQQQQQQGTQAIDSGCSTFNLRQPSHPFTRCGTKSL